MSFGENSLSARDIAYVVHPQTNLKQHLEDGLIVIDHANGVWVYDDGNAMLDGVSGLWCASLGFAPAYIISEDEIGEIGVRLRKSLDEVHAEVAALSICHMRFWLLKQ